MVLCRGRLLLDDCRELGNGVERQLGKQCEGMGVLRRLERIFTGGIGAQRGSDGMARLESLAIDQQTAGPQIAATLDFDGDDITAEGTEEIHLSLGVLFFAGPVAGRQIARGAKFLLHKLFCQSTFEFAEDIVTIQH